MSFLDKHSVLVLNSLYQPIGCTSIKQALVSMNSSSGDSPAAKSIDIQYDKNLDGSWNLSSVIGFRALNFEEWIQSEFREGLDTAVHSTKLKIRCPSVLLTLYSKMPTRKFRPTKSLLYEKQDGRCGYSNKRMNIKAMNIEHLHPKSLGGKDNWENLMLVDQEINNKRGNKPLKELGLRPLFLHKEPKPIPAAYTIRKLEHPDWAFFIEKLHK